jgi:sporulation protein YqfC
VESKSIKTKETIAEKLDLPRDVMLNIPKITITGSNEIIVENHKGFILAEGKPNVGSTFNVYLPA